MSDLDLSYRDSAIPSEKAPRQRRKAKKTAKSPAVDVSKGDDNSMPRVPHKLSAVSTSLDSIHVPPRTPRTVRYDENDKPEDGIELNLLNDDERRAAAADDDVDVAVSRVKGVSGKDKRSMALLIVLCECFLLTLRFASESSSISTDLIQGVPVSV